MSCEASQYYGALFTEDSPSVMDQENLIIGCILFLVCNEMNESLMHPISLSELEEVVFGMRKGKALGPDGFPIEFFQEFWDIINLDFLELVQESYSNKQMLKAMNSTFLVLFPKMDGANQLDFLGPIVICNVVYKVVTKLTAERVKSRFTSLIFDEQGDFVVGRQILDGVVVASKSIHSMVVSKEKSMLIKLDMTKAYDRVR